MVVARWFSVTGARMPDLNECIKAGMPEGCNAGFTSARDGNTLLALTFTGPIPQHKIQSSAKTPEEVALKICANSLVDGFTAETRAFAGLIAGR